MTSPAAIFDFLRSDAFAAAMRPELVPVREAVPRADDLPYPSCREPDACRAKGYCVRDPNCGE